MKDTLGLSAIFTISSEYNYLKKKKGKIKQPINWPLLMKLLDINIVKQC